MKKILMALCLVFFAATFVMAKGPFVDCTGTYISKTGVLTGTYTDYWKYDKFRKDDKDFYTIGTHYGAWEVLPKSKLCIRRGGGGGSGVGYDFISKDARDNIKEGCAEYSEKFLKKEVVNGHPTDKYEIRCKGSYGEVSRWHIWFATDIKFWDPIKKVDLDNGDMKEWKNIKLGPLPDSLFKCPEGYKEFDENSEEGRKEITKRLLRDAGGLSEKDIEKAMKAAFPGKK
jgi:hypothetical protein